MAAVCAAFASRQLTRSAGPRFSPIYRRAFASSPFLRAPPTPPDASSKPTVPNIRRGSLASGSIFADADPSTPNDLLKPEGRKPQRRPGAATDTDADANSTAGPLLRPSLDERNPEHIDRALNPFPNRRARWERKMVIRSIRRRGRLTKTEHIMQTERESLSKSHFFKTSIKKLAPLARQIAGKNIDDAILQMRWSVKKAAKDVKEHLIQAKNEATTVRGMGLGLGKKNKEPITVTLKSGEKKVVTDPTAIYIAQAWVGRGTFGRELDHRARGRINVMRPPYTSLTVVLKEEKTRVREWEDREKKEVRKRRENLRVSLPDRKIFAQRQYYSW
ncbi:54S ribosomal protein L22, mitochondrial [Onygenales sp. PD_40]|nr:54S ribosomal protein L22, mitochondrial [Onygenales sp. PD_40]KAK2769510.1 54S ribosomal protein L22, mitochondrial [Emmonsiellopsis sp. PD_33]KAK2785201.1 54S ribosomal protein L22, mitochondrial [Onygenales sp. PD_12]KAK2797434.1 54S ribosomal protein L22, mitochondrial [Onygenales sp. PD_10]